MLELIMIRHGETELNSQGVYYGSTDCCLTERGYLQAEEIRQKLEEHHFDYIYSSDLKRALDTARRIVGSSPICEEKRLREMDFGLWEGRHYKKIEEEDETLYRAWCEDYYKVAPPEGQSLETVHLQVKSFISELLELKDKKVLIVAHQGPLRLILSELLNIGEKGFWNFTFQQGCISSLEIDPWGNSTVRYINR